jgi:poly[(R)-3-hydroxyalkanoate] polymerase subunit PhaC
MKGCGMANGEGDVHGTDLAVRRFRGKRRERNGAAPAEPVAAAPSRDVPRAGRPRLREATQAILDRVDTAGLSRALLREARGLAGHPVASARAIGRFTHATLVALGTASVRITGTSVEGPLPRPAKDRRFGDPAWRENALFYALLQLHLARERLARDLVDAAGLNEMTARKARLASQLVVDAVSPSNFLFTNPAALKRAFETGGLSVLRGLRNFLADLRHRRGMPRQVDASGFELGKNLAATPGKVVYRNELMELIQYAPQTPTVFSVPLLCSPPWINKYYIMDLAPGRSFVEWAVRHGHTTFAISYRNPDASMRDVAMDDYLERGLDDAVRVVRDVTRSPKVNVVGLCLGGTLATAHLAWLAQGGGEEVINSLTLLNTLVDFADPGILATFTDPETVSAVERMMASRGFLDADKMASAFNLIRATDLIFNDVASNWLAGEEPAALDLLAWNVDSTRMPARMQGYYLKSCYVENQLARGEMVLGGRRLDIGAIHQDAFVLAAIDDHIAPWRTQFKTTQLLGGDVRFVLSSSGHIAGIVNPPSKKAAHWSGDGRHADPDAWLASAKQHGESWWEEWARWIARRAGEHVPPRPPGTEEYPVLGDAPGTYVRSRAHA